MKARRSGAVIVFAVLPCHEEQGMKMNRLGVLALVLLNVGIMSPTLAQNVRTLTTPTAPGKEQTSRTRPSDEKKAHEWGLKAEEWARYNELMQGPLGVHSPGLDPLTALGIEARSDEERRRYATLQVQVEARRVDKILAYQRAYDAAWQQQFSGQPRVKDLSGNAATDPRQSASRLAVFVKSDCPPCEQRVQQLQRAGTPFDLYLVDSRGEDARVREFAQRAGIDPAKVKARTITLNHDEGRWVERALRGDLPAVLRQVGGKWQRQ
jgi:integrating conjugative element protein (TIGR03759 family)